MGHRIHMQPRYKIYQLCMGSLGVNTTPMREALVRLVGAVLVRLTPNRGARVTSISLADICYVMLVQSVCTA